MNDIMRKIHLSIILFIFSSVLLPGVEVTRLPGDTIDVQKLYNGRAWKNLYYKIKGDQFLFTTDFIPGSVTIDNKEFRNIRLKYDIYNDDEKLHSHGPLYSHCDNVAANYITYFLIWKRL